MKIQASIKSTQNKIKEFNLKSKLSVKENWKKEEVKSFLTLQSSVSAPRLHQNYDFVMIKGNRTLKGLTAKFKGLVEEPKPLYVVMQKNADPLKFWGNEKNPYLVSQGFELPNTAIKSPKNKNDIDLIQNNNPQKVASPKNKTSIKAQKKADKLIGIFPENETNIFSQATHLGKMSLPPIYPRKIKNRYFQSAVQQ
ncbi:hypothetical protein TTHERM_00143760 (macronuclear) [Tetrahymena thermophila SB210]|uniref:Uncharacterized protein n=1 Tax=Tetrahymena thermophila (strain SB210) TaxID=312017 RepID=I7MDS6_TETTS|nr:hypothetical protein TTHERM_00143760 [Tetrahymena thermophila SB210]EAR90870.2 hypothetical protein TTHERM_00143760 [Tetrahymena thermophila SB210]|eukprot:XP_001011115.2 hypothetical protein TTHERM_00143760 [Tetrahymena thermophila SB210]